MSVIYNNVDLGPPTTAMEKHCLKRKHSFLPTTDLFQEP